MRSASVYFSKEFEELMKAYLATVKNSRTAKEYWGYVCLICDYLEMDFLDIKSDHAQRYMNYLYNRYQQETLSRKTINVRLSCYKMVAAFIASYYNDCYENPFESIKVAPIDANVSIGHVPTMTEMDSIMSAAKEMGNMYYLIIALASRCGLSVKEITGITAKNIKKTSTGTYTILLENAKGNARYVPLSADVSNIFDEYLSNISSGTGNIFLNAHKNPITAKNIEVAVKKIIEQSGIGKHYTMRDFRTRAIVDMKKCGVDDGTLSDYTGISQSRITRFNNVVEQVGDCPADLVNYQLNE